MPIQIPSVYDKTLTPGGKHVMSIWALYAPVTLRDGSWDISRQRVGEAMIDRIGEYAPNIRDAIIDWELFTPQDLEERVYLTDENIRQLDITPQDNFSRARRDAVRLSHSGGGLYLCDAGTPPGGEVTGAPDHNAAHAVLKNWEMA
jgi:phytoene dehydrogenase-like protein